MTTTETPGTYSGVTDKTGTSRVTFTVAMQPGYNYLAAASLIEPTLTQNTIYNGQSVNPQQHADAMSVATGPNSTFIPNGGWSGRPRKNDRVPAR